MNFKTKCRAWEELANIMKHYAAIEKILLKEKYWDSQEKLQDHS